MGQRKPILPNGYGTEPDPTPLEQHEIDRLVKWITLQDDPYMLAYCLHWGLGVNPEIIQRYIGKDEIVRKIRAFPNLCRRHLRKGLKTVIGFDDLHRIFERIMETDFEILLLTPFGASCISNSNHLAYLSSLIELQEECRQREITFLNRHPSLKSERCHLPSNADVVSMNISSIILELPEKYEQIIWMHFIGQKSIMAISQELGIQRTRGIIEYCRRLISKHLGFEAPLDDDSMLKILSEL